MGSLVVGGAGYVGSHVAHLLADRGDTVWVVDDFSTGLPTRLGTLPSLSLDITSAEAPRALSDLITSEGLDTVYHFAALKSVGESLEAPLRYYDVNVHGLVTVLEAATGSGVERFIFSSSAAVYGDAPSELITEEHPTSPLSPYGRSKLMGEWIVRDAATASGLAAASLRYFNVAGTSAPELADRGSSNLIPRVLRLIANGERPEINGDDYDTPDGTCVRDYIDVSDLAAAHVYVADRLAATPGAHETLNVGTGIGLSVSEVVARALDISGASLEPLVGPRREGDPSSVVADSSRLHALGWHPTRGVDEMIESTWRAMQASA